MSDGEEQGKEQGTEIVGYCSPPVATRFQPGRSGNPKGRPKGTSLTTILRDTLAKTEIRGVSLNGRTVGEALVESMLAQAIKGNVGAMRLIVDRADGRLGSEPPDGPDDGPET